MEYRIPTNLEGERLDSALAELSGLSRSRVAKLLAQSAVSLDGKALQKPSFRVEEGMAILVELPPDAPIKALAQDIPLEILYQDADIAVINKPRGMVVHPAPGNPDGTLVNALLHHLPDLSGIGGELRPGIVHRLDKDTTGLMVIAKNDAAHQALAEQFASRSLRKEYLALLRGNLPQDEGRVEQPIARHPKDRKRMAVCPDGKEAITTYRVLRRYAGACLIACGLHTGRTHQIRVHMAALGHPVLEDPVYGGTGKGQPLQGKGQPLQGKGQLLHSWKLAFTHPREGMEMRFVAKPDERFLLALREYEKTRR